VLAAVSGRCARRGLAGAGGALWTSVSPLLNTRCRINILLEACSNFWGDFFPGDACVRAGGPEPLRCSA